MVINRRVEGFTVSLFHCSLFCHGGKNSEVNGQKCQKPLGEESTASVNGVNYQLLALKCTEGAQ